ncbi:MAG: sugar isomerase domain-containing protein [Deinococcus-Thermus bacterium]|nr:sugar isomerase domain-containing protein [Deinococcota bacterium]
MSAIETYRDAVLKLVEAAVDERRSALEAAASAIADAVAAGGLVYLTGSGHAHMMAEEPFYRAGGLAAVHPILVPSLMLHESAVRSTRLERLPGVAREVLADTSLGTDDLLIVASNSGRNAYPVEAALVGRERGATVVALTSVPHGARVTSRHPSGRTLMEVADLVLDTGAPYGDAAVPLGDARPAVGPVSTVLGAFLLNAAFARATELLFERGADPDVFASANLETGESLSAERLDAWRRRVKPL